MRHPEILDFLRGEGLTVIETNGWRTAGSDVFGPRGSLNHHTAGARSGNAPSLGIILNGRPGIPPRLSHTLQSRERDRNGLDVVYLCAAGRANHAGRGGFGGLTGNSSVWGNEVEHVGTTAEPYDLGRFETTTRIHTAFAKCSHFAGDMVAEHHEWTDRKVDFLRALLDPLALREAVDRRLKPRPPTVGPIHTTPGSLEDSLRLLVSVPVRDHRGYVDLRKGVGNLPTTIGADRVLAITFAGNDPGDSNGWGPKALAPPELVDAAGVARIVVPGHEIKDGNVGVYVTVAD